MALRRMWIAIGLCGALMGCAGPNGERPVLDGAVQRPSSTPYGFSGGYAGATGSPFSAQ